MIKLIVAIVISSLLVSCSLLSSKEENDLVYDLDDLKVNLDVTKMTLANGLRVLLVEDHRLPIASYYTFYDVGGRYEAKGVTGATHFLEHMMFKGAKKYGPGEFDRIIDGSGGRNNAYTTFDSTVYYENFPSGILETIIDLESDRMGHLTIGKDSFVKEKAVILEERKSNYENRPSGKLYLAMMQAVFAKTPYGLSVIGDEKDVQSLRPKNLKDFFKKFYSPNNAVVVVAGDINIKKTSKLIKKYYSSIPASPKVHEVKRKMDDPKRFFSRAKFKREIHLNGQAETPMFMIAYQGEPYGSRKAMVLDFLANIMGGGQSSYLYQNFVSGKYPKLNNIGVSNSNLKNGGVFFISGQFLPKVGIKSFKRSYRKVMRKACDEAVDKRSIMKTKNRLLVSYYNALETNAGVASLLGESEHFFGDYAYYKNELDIYNSITTDEVRQACHNIFRGDRSIYLTIWKGNRKR